MRVKLPAMAWFGLLFAVIIGLTLLVPPSQATVRALHVVPATYHLIVFLILVPYGLVWLTAFYAYKSLGEYTQTLTDTVEGRGFDRLVRGLKIFAWGLVLTVIVSQLIGLIRFVDPAFGAAQTVINRYLTLLVTIGAFVSIQDGTYILLESVHARRSRLSIRTFLAVITTIGVIFVGLVIRNHQQAGNPYYLPLGVLLITIVVPYIWAWAIGLVSANELRMYARRVKGILYQRGLQVVVNGLRLLILSSIAGQYITAAFAGASTFSLGWLLVVVYLLLLLEAVGLALVSIGAKQLQKIEVV